MNLQKSSPSTPSLQQPKPNILILQHFNPSTLSVQQSKLNM